MKRTIILIMICLSMCVVGCAKEDNRDYNHIVVDADALRFPAELLEGTDEQVRYIRENVVFCPDDVSENEGTILSEADRHPKGETCQDCGLHVDYLRKESVDINTAKQVEDGMTVREVFDLIGNPHLRYGGYHPLYPNSSSVINGRYYYYVLSDGNVLKVWYALDGKTGVKTAVVETMPTTLFFELYSIQSIQELTP